MHLEKRPPSWGSVNSTTRRVTKAYNPSVVDETILHYEIHCKRCGAPILLPVGMIGRLFADPDAQPNQSHAIAVVCRRCKSIETYFLERHHPGHNAMDGVRFAYQGQDTMDGSMLGCDEEACNALVPLLAQWNVDTTTDERKAEVATWQWRYLQCPLGHSISKPDWKHL